MADITLEQLEARVAFLEAWSHIPARYLPGYVTPEPESAPEPEPEEATGDEEDGGA